jgi:hypothetical protein
MEMCTISQKRAKEGQVYTANKGWQLPTKVYSLYCLASVYLKVQEKKKQRHEKCI